MHHHYDAKRSIARGCKLRKIGVFGVHHLSELFAAQHRHPIQAVAP